MSTSRSAIGMLVKEVERREGNGSPLGPLCSLLAKLFVRGGTPYNQAGFEVVSSLSTFHDVFPSQGKACVCHSRVPPHRMSKATKVLWLLYSNVYLRGSRVEFKKHKS
jgi:hypothetical protein